MKRIGTTIMGTMYAVGVVFGLGLAFVPTASADEGNCPVNGPWGNCGESGECTVNGGAPVAEGNCDGECTVNFMSDCSGKCTINILYSTCDIVPDPF